MSNYKVCFNDLFTDLDEEHICETIEDIKKYLDKSERHSLRVVSIEKVEERMLFYDPDTEQCLDLTIDEATDYVKRNHEHYTGRFICGMYDMNPCLVMETKGETK